MSAQPSRYGVGWCAGGDPAADPPVPLRQPGLPAADVRRTDHAGSGDIVDTGTYPAAGAAGPHTLRTLTRNTPGGSTTTAYEYDPTGNLAHQTTAGTVTDFSWDPDGKLVAERQGSSTTSYRYDADGNQLMAADPAGATLYLKNMEIHADNLGHLAATRYYEFAGDVIAARTGAQLSWTLTDRQDTGQTQISADPAQRVTRRYHTPFGADRGNRSAGWLGQRGFVGGTENLGTSVITLGARQYDPTTGRFISPDPVTNFDDPQQLNGYAYANDNPTSKSDPTGLMVPCSNGAGGCGTTGYAGGAKTPRYCDIHDCNPGLHVPVRYYRNDRLYQQLQHALATYWEMRMRAYLAQLRAQREQQQRQANKNIWGWKFMSLSSGNPWFGVSEFFRKDALAYLHDHLRMEGSACFLMFCGNLAMQGGHASFSATGLQGEFSNGSVWGSLKGWALEGKGARGIVSGSGTIGWASAPFNEQGKLTSSACGFARAGGCAEVGNRKKGGAWYYLGAGVGTPGISVIPGAYQLAQLF